MKRKTGQLNDTFAETLSKIATEISNRKLQQSYSGDISDLGNEIGHALGKVLSNMNEVEITDFIHGLRHGISMTNETH